jgi:cell division protein FtsN
MPNQDYISRSPTKKKKNTSNKSTKKGDSARSNKKSTATKTIITVKTKIVALAGIILVCAFAFGLWVLKTAPSTKTPAPTVIPTNTETKNAVKEQAQALPEPPKEKWSYVKDLENKKIEVGQYEVKKKGPYQMQCGSFRTEKQAQVLKANIAFTGISSQIKSATGTNGTWYKVVLGPYKRKRLAESDKHKLKRNNINHCQIWLWR